MQPCLFTTQVTKKHPKWVDGFAEILAGSRLRIYDESRKALTEGPCDFSDPDATLQLGGAFLVQLLSAPENTSAPGSLPVGGAARGSLPVGGAAPLVRGPVVAQSVVAPRVPYGGGALQQKKRRAAGLLRRSANDASGIEDGKPLPASHNAALAFGQPGPEAAASCAAVGADRGPQPSSHTTSSLSRLGPHAASCIPMVRRPAAPEQQPRLGQHAAPPNRISSLRFAPPDVDPGFAGHGRSNRDVFSGGSVSPLSVPVAAQFSFDAEDDWWLAAPSAPLPAAHHTSAPPPPLSQRPVFAAQAANSRQGGAAAVYAGCAADAAAAPPPNPLHLVSVPPPDVAPVIHADDDMFSLAPVASSQWSAVGPSALARPVNAGYGPGSASVPPVHRHPPPLPKPRKNSASALTVPGPTVCLAALASSARLHCAHCPPTGVSAAASGGVAASRLPTARRSDMDTCPECFWRRTALAVSYPSPTEYTTALLHATAQEVVVLLASSTERYWRAAAAVPRSGGRAESFATDYAPSSNRVLASAPAIDVSQFQRICHEAHSPFYATCELIRLVKKQQKPAERRQRGGSEASEESAGATRNPKKRPRGRSPTRGRARGDDGDAAEAAEDASPRYFLRFPRADREKAAAYSRDDLWVVSSEPQFGHALPPDWPLAAAALQRPAAPGGSGGGGGPRGGRGSDFFSPSPAAASFVWLGRAAFHGPSSSDMIEILPVCPRVGVISGQPPARGHSAASALGFEFVSSLAAPPPPAAFGHARSIRVCALHGPNISGEVAALEALAHMRGEVAQGDAARFPLHRFLATPPRSAAPSSVAAPRPAHDGHQSAVEPVRLDMTSAQRDSFVDAACLEFKLNGDQASVLRSVASAMSCARDVEPIAAPSSPVVLVHGVFGAGKSHTLVALCVLFSRLLDESEMRCPPAAEAPVCDGSPIAAAASSRPAYTDGIIDLSPDDDNDDRSSPSSSSGGRGEGSDDLLACSPLGKHGAVDAPASPSAGAAAAPACCILVAASTNVAVDRVLLGLQAAGFPDFARVGAVRKCAKAVLPHLLPYEDNPEARSHTLNDMRALLSEPSCGGHDREAVAEAVHRLQSDDDHVRRLGSARVIGTTCAATSFPCLRGRVFRVCILDESSQMIEPASLLPLQFGAQLAVCAGDPQQLPPVLATLPRDVVSAGAGNDLSRLSLFVRLALAGVPILMLRTQYRCHPVLSQLCSRLFYDGAVVDGVAPWQRGPRIRGLAPLTFYDYSGLATPAGAWSAAMAEQLHAASGSIFNAFEAGIAARLVAALLSRGQAPKSIGVICLYKAQVWEVQRRLPPDAQGVQVATVDAFQGSERSIVVLCCSRTMSGGGGGTSGVVGAGAAPTAAAARFVDDSARLNVAFSRAQHHLLVVGHARCLSTSPLWAAVLSCARGLPGGLRSCHVVAPPAGEAAEDALLGLPPCLQ